ncbi:ATP-binding protein [Caldanaerobacter subterraneus]|nr:ATP-binding protein [Caldanaerobacter subterraneus]
MVLDINLVMEMFRNNLRTRAAIVFISIALISIVIVSITTNILIINSFGNYVIKSTDKEFSNIANTLAAVYKSEGGWKSTTGREIAHAAMMEGYGLRLRDKDGKIIWDFSSMSYMMNMMGKWNKKNISEKTLPIIVDEKTVGYVDIIYYGPIMMSDLDFKFLCDISRYNVIATVIAIFIALTISIYVSNYITKPLINITEVAKKLEKGDFTAKVYDIPKEDELFKLTAAINHLGESLKNQEILRKQMTSDIAHELRTPLTTLQSHIEAMLDGVWEPTHERLKSLNEEVLRLINIVKDLETLNKFESDMLKLNKIKFDASELVKSILTNFEASFAEKEQEVVKNIEDNIMLFGDKDRIAQVFVNLISNSNKYTPVGGKIKIDFYKDGDYAVFIVEDNGMGISKDDIPFIFERFYRGEKSRNRETGGSGIGLSIAKAIVLAHGGEISVESEINKGSKFTVKIPL